MWWNYKRDCSWFKKFPSGKECMHLHAVQRFLLWHMSGQCVLPEPFRQIWLQQHRVGRLTRCWIRLHSVCVQTLIVWPCPQKRSMFSLLCEGLWDAWVQGFICLSVGNWGTTEETGQLQMLWRINSWIAQGYPCSCLTQSQAMQQSIIYWWLSSCFAKGTIRFPITADLRCLRSSIMFQIL